MNSRITEKFKSLRKQNKKALITYITGGDPDLNTTFNLVLGMEKAGVDIVEIGIPYSDPLADGPVIQAASQRALKAGTNIDSIFQMVFKLRKQTNLPLVLLVYFNSIYKYGIKKFLDNCQDSGIDGLIIPDLPLEERVELNQMMNDYPIDLIALVAPTSEDRIKEIVSDAKGFIYCISSNGVTGTRNHFDTDLPGFMKQIKKYTTTPLALGFGISSPQAVSSLKELCDGLIVGSAIIKKIEDGITEGNIENQVIDFVEELSEAIG